VNTFPVVRLDLATTEIEAPSWLSRSVSVGLDSTQIESNVSSWLSAPVMVSVDSGQTGFDVSSWFSQSAPVNLDYAQSVGRVSSWFSGSAPVNLDNAPSVRRVSIWPPQGSPLAEIEPDGIVPLSTDSGFTGSTSAFWRAMQVEPAVKRWPACLPSYSRSYPIQRTSLFGSDWPVTDLVSSGNDCSFLNSSVSRVAMTLDIFPELVSRYRDKFLGMANSQSLEFGFISPTDVFLEELLETHDRFFGEILSGLYLKVYSNEGAMVALLKGMSNLPYSKVQPFGPTCALAALSHVSDEVKEAGVRAFEKWAEPETLSYLTSVKCASEWLESYRLSTVEYLQSLP